jgi:hypothetical protein
MTTTISMWEHGMIVMIETSLQGESIILRFD